jgi:sugar-specific transcriptional regulator TrmB
MDNELQLQELGLTKNEAKVYLALLDIGLTTTSKIIKKIGINTSKVYESLERLLKKGLVSYTIIKNKKHWQAEDPQQLTTFLEEQKKHIDEKQKQINKVIPQLQTLQKINPAVSEYRIFEGIKGIKTAREEALKILKPGDTFYLILSTYPKIDTLNAYYADFQEKRAKKGIKYKAIFNNLFKESAERMKKLANSEVRYAVPTVFAPTWTEIYGDCVCIGVMGSKPSVFVIKNADVAKGYRELFDNLWKQIKNE